MSRVTAGFGRWFMQPPRAHGEIIEDRTVGFLELLYDLVYVVLIGQAAQGLAGHPDWAGVGRFAVVFAIVWVAWLNGSAYHELHGREDGRNRTLMFVQMILLAVMGTFVADAASPGAAGARDGFGFAVTDALLLLLFTWQWAAVRRQDTVEMRRVSTPYLVGMVASVVVMGGSALLPQHARPWAWAAFALAWVVGPSILWTRARSGAGTGALRVTESMAERFGLFTLIVIGEVVAGVVEGLATSDRSVASIATAALALVVGFGFWWTYFDLAGRQQPRPTGSAFTLWLFSHLPAAAAIAASGAAMVGLIEHASDARTPAPVAWLLAASVAVTLVSLGLTVRALDYGAARSRLAPAMIGLLVAAAALALLIGWAAPAPWLLALLLGLVLAASWSVGFALSLRAGIDVPER